MKQLSIIFIKEFKSLIVSRLAWSIMAILQLIISFQFLAHIEKYIDLSQKQGATVNITDMIITPLYGAMTISLLLITPILTSRQISGEYKNNSMSLLLSSPIPAWKIIVAKYLASSCFLYLCILLLSLMPLSLSLAGAIDFGQITASILGVCLCVSAFIALGLYLSSLTKHPSIAMTTSLGMLLFLWLINQTASGTEFSLLGYLSLLYHLQAFLMGSVETVHISFFVLFSSYFILLTINKIKVY